MIRIRKRKPNPVIIEDIDTNPQYLVPEIYFLDYLLKEEQELQVEIEKARKELAIWLSDQQV